MVRHFVDLFDVNTHEAEELLRRAAILKEQHARGIREPHLPRRTLGLIFEKPSLRTRVSFQAAITQLGGASIFLRDKDVGMGSRETTADFARVLSQYVDVLALRTYAHATVEELARHASVPVINALSDASHPCQAMADMLTIQETFGRLDGINLVFVGDGNNVARSLALAAGLLGVQFALAAPPGYEFPDDFREAYRRRFPEIPLVVDHDPLNAVMGADVVYTDVWASMGQEHEAAERRETFAPFQVNSRLFGQAKKGSIFLHCLPAHRGEEVTSDVLDGPQSRVIEQASNRMHFQKALLLWLLLDEWPESLDSPVTN
ncbi:MAG: ornithine carbamoyltransferase [Isosphaeraceae bacterium]